MFGPNRSRLCLNPTSGLAARVPGEATTPELFSFGAFAGGGYLRRKATAIIGVVLYLEGLFFAWLGDYRFLGNRFIWSPALSRSLHI